MFKNSPFNAEVVNNWQGLRQYSLDVFVSSCLRHPRAGRKILAKRQSLIIEIQINDADRLASQMIYCLLQNMRTHKLTKNKTTANCQCSTMYIATCHSRANTSRNVLQGPDEQTKGT